MSNNALLAVAIGAAVYLVVTKQAQATTTSGGVKLVTPSQVDAGRQNTVNVNGDMWTRLMGSSWKELAGGAASIYKNQFGQQVSADGKPISTGDPLSFYYQLQAGEAIDLPGIFDDGLSLPSGVSPESPLNLWESGANEGYSWDDIRGLA